MNHSRSDVDGIHAKPNSPFLAYRTRSKIRKHKKQKNMKSNNDTIRRVHFVSVETREYPMTLGVNPATRIGVPVCLSWEYRQLLNKSFQEDKSRYQSQSYHQRSKSPHSFYLNYYQRKEILERAGFNPEELKRAETSIRWDRSKRKLSEYQSFPSLWIKAWKVQYGGWKAKSFVKKYRKENGLKGRKKKRPEQSKTI